MDLVTTKMLLLANTRPLTFFGKYSAHLDYRGWKGRGGARREGPGGRGGEGEGQLSSAQSEALVPN